MLRIKFLLPIAIFLHFSLVARAQEPHGTGLNFADENQYRSIPLASTPLLGNIPNAIDLSSYFPRPGNQGQQSSCVGWAISNLKAYQERVERKWSLNRNDHIFSPAYIYNQIKTAPSCQGGSSFIDALNLLRKNGIARLSDFPYDDQQCASMPNSFVNQRSREFSIADWRRVNPQDETEVKTQIAAGFPVLFGMIVDDKFSQIGAGEIYAGPVGQSRGGHAMVAVGYSDAHGAFKVINSWGQEWGAGGFGWINYRTFRSLVREAYVAQDIVVMPLTPSPTPDDPGPPDSPIPTPRPAPAPVVQTEIAMGVPFLVHNAMVSSPTGLQPGLQIRVPGTVRNSAGRSMQIIVKFNYMNGPPLYANASESFFRDAGGLSSTGTSPIPVATNLERMDGVVVGMPYYALNFQPSGGINTYNLSFTVIALIDNELKAQSGPIPFQVRW